MAYYPLRVSIPEPCHEDWSQMTTVDERRRHCAACDKTLIDFSTMSDPEIFSHLRRNEGKLCGRFRADQLQRKIYPHPPKRFAGIRALAASAAMLLSVPVFAQQQTEKLEEVVLVAGNTSSSPAKTEKAGSIRIYGLVTDEEGEGLIGASVLIKGTTTGTVTDLDGRYSLLVPMEDSTTLVFTYTGFSTTERVLTHEELLEMSQSEAPMTMELNYGALMGGSIIISYTNPRPTLLENLLPHKIFTYKPEKPDGYYYGKTGDWKDYWRELFAKRKARRAERKAERQLARAERRALKADGQPNLAPAAAPSFSTKIDLGWEPAPSPISDLTVSPNPFEDHLAVSINLTENTILNFHLIDVNGKLLYRWETQTLAGPQSLTLDLTGDSLPGGTYFLRVVGERQLYKTVTLVR